MSHIYYSQNSGAQNQKKNHISCILPEFYVTVFLQGYVKMFPSNTWLEKFSTGVN